MSLPKPGSVNLSKVRLKPPKALDVDSVADGISKAGRKVGRTGEQFGEMAKDIQRAGETTERVGKLLSK